MVELYRPGPGIRSLVSTQIVVEPDFGIRYDGKIAVLINEETSGDAEYACLLFKAVDGIRFVGRPTNGTIGGRARIRLPGIASIFHTAADIRFPDGRPIQRVGIEPDIHVERTIEGIREGRDEVLEAAIKYLSEVIE